jgi:hypothetical protein
MHALMYTEQADASVLYGIRRERGTRRVRTRKHGQTDQATHRADSPTDAKSERAHTEKRTSTDLASEEVVSISFWRRGTARLNLHISM